MSVPKNCRDLAPNLYMQCTAPTHQIRENKRPEEIREKRDQSKTRENNRIENQVQDQKKEETERVDSEILLIWELSVSPRIAREVKINPELRIWSKSSIRPDDSLNCTWSDYNR